MNRFNDKKEIALALRDSTFEEELGCSLLEKNVLNGCGDCNLECICRKVDKLCDEYVQETTKVTKVFTFKIENT